MAPALARRAPGAEIRLLEVGFGRGLNTAAALAALAAAGWEGPLQALGLEPHPAWLRPWPEPPGFLKAWAPWWGQAPGPWRLASRPHWQGAVETAAAPVRLPSVPTFDWLFLDLFSPGRHPEDWSAELYPRLARSARAGAILTSYCCARSVRDGLARAGWRVERLRSAGRRDSLVAQMPWETGISA